MADMTLATAGKINVLDSGPTIQATAPAAAAITAGSPVFYDANGRFAVSDANNTAADACYGIATRSVVAGEALTAVRSGVMDGWSNLPVPGAGVWVSDTAGALADAAPVTVIRVGIVEAVWGQPIGTAADRVLRVECTGLASAA